MGKTTRPEYRGAWPRIRKAILQRDNHLCQIRAPRCTTHATHVDHIIPVTQGGPWWDHDNLRAACQNCNLGRIDHKRNERWRKANTHITLIVGPPGAPKFEHAQTLAKPGDLIIDYDEIKKALQNLSTPQNLEPPKNLRGTQNLGGHVFFEEPVAKDQATALKNDELHEATMAIRNSLLKKLREGTLKVGGAFIISSNSRGEDMFPYHRVVVVDPGLEKTVSLIRERGYPPHWIQLANQWYKDRSTSGNRNGRTESSRNW
jgi:hypothetical protein